jgi:hypothetical protein
MNIMELQNRLKSFSEQQLVQEMQRPTGELPQFLVLSEITRRKKMQADLAAAQTKQNETTVVEDAVAAAGVPQEGATQMAQAMAPKTDMTQNTGLAAQPRRMAGGGVVALQEGGPAPETQIVRSGIVYYLQPNGTYVSDSGRVLSDVATNLRNTGADLQTELSDIAQNTAEAYQARMPDFSGVQAQMDMQRAVADQAAARSQGPVGGPRPPAVPYTGPDFTDVNAQMLMQQTLAAQAAQRPQGPVGGPRPPAAPYTGPDFSGVQSQMGIQQLIAAQAAARPQGPVGGPRPPAAGIAAVAGPQFGYTPVGSLPAAPRTAADDLAIRNGLVPAPAQVTQGPAGGPAPVETYDLTVPDMSAVTAQMEAQRAVADQAAQRPQGPAGGPRPPAPPAPEGPSLLEQFHAIELPAAPTSVYDAMDILHGRERTPPPGPQLTPGMVPPMSGLAMPAPPPAEPSLMDTVRDTLSGLTSPAADTPPAPVTDTPPAPAADVPPAAPAAPPAVAPAAAPVASGVAPSAGVSAAPSAAPSGGIASVQSTTTATTAEGEGIQDYGTELTQMLQARERRAEQDRWLALAQAGMALMASKSPTFGGALGEAGMVGIGAFREGQTAAEQDRFAMLKDLEAWRMQQMELAMAQQAMAMRGSGGGGGSGGSGGSGRLPNGLTANQYADLVLAQLEAVNASLDSYGGMPPQTAEGVSQYDALRSRQTQLTGALDALTGISPVSTDASAVYSMDDVQ